jgi:hypothetical protein
LSLKLQRSSKSPIAKQAGMKEVLFNIGMKDVLFKTGMKEVRFKAGGSRGQHAPLSFDVGMEVGRLDGEGKGTFTRGF